MTMLENPDFLNMHIFMLTDEIGPYQRHTYHCNKTLYAFYISQMGVLDIETGGLHGPEQSLDLPSFPICPDSLMGVVVADENLKFRDALAVFEPCAGEIYILSVHEIWLVVEKLLTKSDTVEQIPCPRFFGRPRILYPEVLTDTYVVTYSHGVEPPGPVLAHELPVGYKAVDAAISEELPESFDKFFALSPSGIATLWHQFEYQGKRHAFVGHPEHEDVYVEPAKLPVGTVHAQHKPTPIRKQREYHPCNQIQVKGILCKKSLNPSHIEISLGIRRHSCRKLMETDLLHHTERMDEQRHQLYTGHIHRFSKMLLHNWRIWLTLTKSLELVVFMEKSRQTFPLNY
jgi:hypothetical protein